MAKLGIRSVEDGLIGLIFREPEIFPKLRDIGVSQSSFLGYGSRKVWETMEGLWETGGMPCRRSVEAQLELSGVYEELDSLYLDQVEEHAPKTENWESWARDLLVLSTKASLFEQLELAKKKLLDPKVGMVDSLKFLEKAVSSSRNFLYRNDPKNEEPLAAGWREFPIEVFPAWVADYLLNVCESLPCPLMPALMPFLIAAGGVLGNRYRIRIKEGFPTWTEPGVFWGVLVAHVSQKKTPAQNYTHFPLWEIEQQLAAVWKEKEAAYKDEIRIHQKKGEGLKGEQLRDHLKIRPVEPPRRRLIVSDITIEALVEKLQDNPSGLILIKDEVTGWFNSFSRYLSGGGGASDVDQWLPIFNAGQVVSDRKTGDRKTTFLPRACVSVQGGIQPRVLGDYFTDKFFANGLGARILFAMPPRFQGGWSDKTIQPELMEQYRKVFQKMFADQGANMEGEPWEPMLIDLESEARKEFVAWNKDYGKQIAANDDDIAASLGKLEAYTARFALLLWFLDFSSGSTKKRLVGKKHVQGAIKITDWFGDEFKRIYRILRANPDTQNSHNLLESILTRDGRVTPAELVHRNSSKYPDSEAAEKALDNLVNLKLGKWEVVPSGPRGGRPTRVFVAKPQKPETAETAETPHRNGKASKK